MSTAQYSKFRNDEEDQMYAPMTAPPPGYSPQGAPPVAYATPMGQSCAPPPPVNLMITAPQTQTIISTTHTMPNDHFGLALFVCLCCFWPIGIVALIKANEVKSRFLMGDLLGANQASEDARKYSMIGLGIGIASVVISIIFIIIYFAFIAVLFSAEISTVDNIKNDLNMGSASILG